MANRFATVTKLCHNVYNGKVLVDFDKQYWTILYRLNALTLFEICGAYFKHSSGNILAMFMCVFLSK